MDRYEVGRYFSGNSFAGFLMDYPDGVIFGYDVEGYSSAYEAKSNASYHIEEFSSVEEALEYLSEANYR